MDYQRAMAARTRLFRHVQGLFEHADLLVGVVPTVTKPFCDDCDRVRLTADGQFRTCLFATSEFDLRAMLRAGASDDELAAEIRRAVGAKWAGHQINQITFTRPRRSMSQIGG